MKQEIMFPNYNNSILNLVTSILKYYNVNSNHCSLEKIDKILSKKYRNIVMIVLDGMGENVLRFASPDGIFFNNKLDTITSVFPTTTTAALTVYYSGKSPLETGWLAWSQYFKEYGSAIDMLPFLDSYTGDSFNKSRLDISELLKYETVYEQIQKSSPNTNVYEIKPSHCDMKTNKCMHIDSIDSLCDSIESLCKNDEDKYIFAYYDNPDTLNHKNGWNSQITKDFILHAEECFKKLAKNLKNSDTLILVSADHGHNNINNYYNILDFDDLQECFILPPFLEARCISFWIKEDKKKKFEKLFNQKFNNEYILYTKENFLKSNLLGYGKKHYKIDDFIGDYIAISISDAYINLGTYLSKEKSLKLSSHCGLTKNEMEVPLIVFDLK